MSISNGNHYSSKLRIEKPSIQSREDDQLWQDVRKYARLIPSEPEPNLGRVREIKELIKNGQYLEPEMIEETAARLAIRFTTKSEYSN
ncbi:MAG: hypothetical protein H6757_03400 [Candidatus Omnitrophica bacterium]|nr:hypothetical protein [Candidatus Omnitrophota bacterium]